MNKAECIRRAENARHEQKARNASAAIYAVAFGGNSDLAQKAFLDADIAGEAARKWDWLANIHPKSREALIRRGDLPDFMFSF